MLMEPDPDTTYDNLLGGAARGRTRARGFAPWSPRAQSLALLSQVQGVLHEYAEYLPLTCRQVFYRLVGAHGYEKTERAYDRLTEMLNRARRANLIPMADIRDGGGERVEPDTWRDADHFLAAARYQAETLRLDRSAGQPTRLILMCEAAGMVEQIAGIATSYGVPVLSSGGFDSVTEKHGLAKDIAYDGRPTEVLHIGDHDPSGAHLFLALAEDVRAFTDSLGGGPVTFTRLAVTPEQITRLHLETAPKKMTDRRAFGGSTCQVEAIAPDALKEIIRDAIEARIDDDALAQVMDREERVHRQLLSQLASRRRKR